MKYITVFFENTIRKCQIIKIKIKTEKNAKQTQANCFKKVLLEVEVEGVRFVNYQNMEHLVKM